MQRIRPSMPVQWLSIVSMYIAAWLGIIVGDVKYYLIAAIFFVIFIIAALWHRNFVDE